MGALKEDISTEKYNSENIKHASFGARLVAMLIDSFVLGAAQMITLIGIGMITAMILGDFSLKSEIKINSPEKIEKSDDSLKAILGEEQSAQSLKDALILLGSQFIAFLVGLMFLFIPMRKWNTTIGKKIVGLKVIRRNGQQKWTFASFFLREIVAKIISLLFFCLGYFWMIWDKDSQTWHDKISKSHVIVD